MSLKTSLFVEQDKVEGEEEENTKKTKPRLKKRQKVRTLVCFPPSN
jgi:hypothetical protein